MSFSGEIYNHLELRDELISGAHRFATRSGTEVILNTYREYGDEGSNHFDAELTSGVEDEMALAGSLSMQLLATQLLDQ